MPDKPDQSAGSGPVPGERKPAHPVPPREPSLAFPTPAEKAEEIRHPDGRIEHPKVRREESDVRFRGLLAGTVIGACLMALIFAATWWFLAPGARVNSAAGFSPLTLPREPRLEELDRKSGVAESNVYDRQLASERVLHGYGLTSQPGFVHIPIREAMKQLAGHLPVRPTPPAGPVKDNGLVDSGESNSGRMFQEAPR